MVSGSEDGSSRLYDSKSGAQLRSFKGHSSPIIDLRCVPGKVLSAHQDGLVSVWDCRGMREETVLGDYDDENSISTDSRSDDSNVTEAIRILERHLRQM